MRRFILLAAALMLWGGAARAQPSSQAAAPSETIARRVALVVGNGAHAHPARLSTVVSNARLMARTLAASGFTLVSGGPVVDADKRGFEAAIEEFGRLARGADIAVFYFSGQAQQHDGNNWLAARDSGPVARPADLESGFVDVGEVMRELEAAQPRLSLVVLDACERNRAGLSPMRAPRGTIVAFANQPGTALQHDPALRNSPYTEALVEAMRVPGLELMQMFNEASRRAIDRTNGGQEPWLAVSPVRGDFVFTDRDAEAPAPPALAVAAQDPNFTLVNFAGRPVRELRASLAHETLLGPDRLGTHLLQAGERFRLIFPHGAGCHVSVRVEFGQGAPPSEIRDLDTCAVDMLMLTPQGQLIPANPDVRLVNETGRAIQRIEAALASDRSWGEDRLEGKAMGPGGTLDVHLPQGLTCDVDIRARFVDGTSRAWWRQDSCSVSQLPLR
ncbi:caspase family protein [Roseococcus sp.]|uniref:caspase family protein n=1 Tax=Roseococcus sp. TaxID=2109646 RepID=UPI003BA9EE2C